VEKDAQEVFEEEKKEEKEKLKKLKKFDSNIEFLSSPLLSTVREQEVYTNLDEKEFTVTELKYLLKQEIELRQTLQQIRLGLSTSPIHCLIFSKKANLQE